MGNKTTAVRQSNIELARLLCMMMILMHHLISHGFYGFDYVFKGKGGLDLVSSFAIGLNGFCYVGVNVFLLITGYFGLKFKWKSLFRIYSIMMFYVVIHAIMDIYQGYIPLTRGGAESILVNFVNFAGTRWWFMNCYIIFMFIAPVIQLDSFTKQQYQKIIVLLTVANLYFGYWWGDYNDGYCVAQFLFMYVIGGYIRRFVSIDKDIRLKAFALYFFACLVFSALSIVNHYVEIPHWYAYKYSNPLIVLGAIGFFLFVLSYSFKNRIINRIAVSALSIYLLQDLGLFHRIISSIGGTEMFQGNACYMIVIVFMMALAFSIIAISVDQIRLLLSKIVDIVVCHTKPIQRRS